MLKRYVAALSRVLTARSMTTLVIVIAFVITLSSMGSVPEVFAQGVDKCPCNFHRMTGDIAKKKMQGIDNRTCTVINETATLRTEYLTPTFSLSSIVVDTVSPRCEVEIIDNGIIIRDDEVTSGLPGDFDACIVDLIAIGNLADQTGLSFPEAFNCPEP